MTFKKVRATALLAALGAAVSVVEAQLPEKFENLQVLDPSISTPKLLGIMRNFTTALGVRCTHCHVGEEGKPIQSYDFKSDAKPTKAAARIMLRMVRAINRDHLSKLPTGEGIEVRCVTCHRGQQEPRMLEDVLLEAYQEKGVEAAVARYRALKKRYYGGFSYDFREGPLNNLAMRLARREKDLEGAIRILELNREAHPQASSVYYLLGEAYLGKGEKELARQSFQKAVELAPENRRAKARLKQLTGQE